eukprot:4486110-Amphidinium_carterae.1
MILTMCATPQRAHRSTQASSLQAMCMLAAKEIGVELALPREVERCQTPPHGAKGPEHNGV